MAVQYATYSWLCVRDRRRQRYGHLGTELLVRSSSQYWWHRHSPDCDNYASASVFAFGLTFMLAFGRIAPVLVPSPRVKHILWPFLEDVDMAVGAEKAVKINTSGSSLIREEFGAFGTRPGDLSGC